MPSEVHHERVAARRIAAIRSTTGHSELSSEIRRLLDIVWPALRAQNVRTDHNVVVYHGLDGAALAIEAGVEVLTEFVDRDPVRNSRTPEGEVVWTAHHGDYSQLRSAYQALERWCADSGRQASGVSWEIYGDWEEDPSKLRTDVYLLLKPL